MQELGQDLNLGRACGNRVATVPPDSNIFSNLTIAEIFDYTARMSFLFEKLDVYQKGLRFAEDVVKTSASFSRGNRELADQLKRAALSIPLNIAEGNGRWHKRERKNHFLIARGSAFECVPLIELCKKLKLVSEEQTDHWRCELVEISKMLSGVISSTEKSIPSEKR